MPFRLSVIVPVYNERKTIAEIIRRVQQTGLAHEIIIVDDGSQDGTRDILPGLNGHDGVRVILHEKNMGKGGAWNVMLAGAPGEIIAYTDADVLF